MSSPTFAIVPSLDATSVTTLATAKEARDALLKDAVAITAITDRMDADCAASTLKELKDFTKSIEASHKEAKAPVLDLGRKIDEVKKDLLTEVEAQASRLGRLAGAFEAEERRKADEERRKAEAEVMRLRREADMKALAAAREAKSIEEASAKAEEIQAKAAEEVAIIKQEQATQAPAARPGLALRKEIIVEVLDAHALYAEDPRLCKIEANVAAIKALIKANPHIKLAGIRHSTIDKF